GPAWRTNFQGVYLVLPHMRKLLFGVVYLILASAPAFADVQLTMQNGRVTIIAKDATVRQILNEWSKVGKTNIVNIERVPGQPLTLELRNVTEGQALEVLLRSLSGYITAPRAEQASNLSQFDRIIIMPTIASARPANQPVQAPPAAPVSPFGGVAVPGMIVAPPPQPGQQPGAVQPVPQPGQPGQPVRRPGGEN